MNVLHISTLDPTRLPIAEAVLTVGPFQTAGAKGERGSAVLTLAGFITSRPNNDEDGGLPGGVVRDWSSSDRLFASDPPLFVDARPTTGPAPAMLHVAQPDPERHALKAVDPKLRDFVKRVFVPALVKRYILATKRRSLVPLSSGVGS